MQAVFSLQSLVDYVRSRRAELGITQAQLAEASGVSVGYVGRLEAMSIQGKPKAETYAKLAKGLRISPEALREIAHGAPPEKALLTTGRPSLRVLGATDSYRYPPTDEERALLEECEREEITVGLWSEPWFWDAEPSKRRPFLKDVRNLLEEVRILKRELG